MERIAVECLSCGQRRIVPQEKGSTFMRVDECPRCGYLGWARSSLLTERARGLMRRHPPNQRRLRTV
jgi:predicted RNA-binding Zn-ribbon protein involved in translation (DUF1610 family)